MNYEGLRDFQRLFTNREIALNSKNHEGFSHEKDEMESPFVQFSFEIYSHYES